MGHGRNGYMLSQVITLTTAYSIKVISFCGYGIYASEPDRGKNIYGGFFKPLRWIVKHNFYILVARVYSTLMSGKPLETAYCAWC